MNPSQGNGSNVPGVKPGVIASGNSDGNPGVTGNGNLGVVGGTTVIASGSGAGVGVVSGANVGMGIGGGNGGVPNATPVGMTRSPLLAQPLATATPVDRTPTGGRNGDIILTPTPANDRKKPKPALIAGIVLIILAVVLGIIAVVMVVSNRNNVNTASGISFNKLINYIISGNDLEARVTAQYRVTGNYYILSDFETEEDKQAVYKNTKDLMDNFAANYEANNNSTDNNDGGENDEENLANLVNSTKQMFDFIYATEFVEPIYGAEVIESGIKNGREATINNMLYRYNLYDLIGDNNSYAIGFRETLTTWMGLLLDKVAFYQENGCITNDDLDTSCILNKGSEIVNKLASFSDDTGVAYQEVNSYYGMSGNFVASVYNINLLLNDGSIMETTK